MPIDISYPEYDAWATSRGQKNQDWYKHPAPVEDIIKYTNSLKQ
ncbi:MAG: DUF4842 domain-containing protein [Candidatus Cryptobacteroides sp.]|nr:DUF4842 domain-containing protein [Rikenellaceae bacterium]MDY5747077.1 DUF4842 domain-containing protein [Candidatus Cryptobacteroides sp.]